MKYIVYQTINTVNKKIYIGVHKTKDPNAFDGYIGCGVYINSLSSYNKPKTPFQCAVKKYGVKSFLRSILYIYDTAEEAYKKESEIVDKDFILNENTYNVALGGAIPIQLEKPLYQFDLRGNLIKKWNAASEVVEFYNLSIYSIGTSLQFKESLLGFFWSREDNINIENYSKGDQKKPVYKYSKNGKCLCIYPSILEASKQENIDRPTLSTSIKLQSLVKDSWYFSDKLYDEFIIKPKKSLKGVTYYLYTIKGEYINKFISKELMNYLNVHSWNTIYRAIHAQNGIYKDYYISLEYLGDKIEEKKNKSAKKSVLVFDKFGNFIAEYESVQQAAKNTNSHLSGVNRVLRGLQHTTNNYIFKFKK